MKVAIIADTHFGARNDNTFFLDYMLQFYEGIFFPYLEKHNIKTVIHLGDLMDRRKYVSFKTAKEFRERFFISIRTFKKLISIVLLVITMYFLKTQMMLTH